MPGVGWLDWIPLPVWFLITLLVSLLAFEGGLAVARSRRVRSDGETRAPLGEIVAATLGLLAFMLAFTFGMAAGRFDARRGLVVDEANAIGTTYLRAGLLPEPHRSEVRALLRGYVAVRVEAASEMSKIAAGIEESERLQTELWSHAEAVGTANPGSIAVGLFITSLNETIDVHGRRISLGARPRVPLTIWSTLYLLASLGMGSIGYHTGMAGAARSPVLLTLIVAFAAVMTLIADLDRPLEGQLRVSQQALVDLQKSMTARHE